MQLAVVAALLEAQRVEIGVQMAAGAIGADHHERADAVARRLTQRLAFRRTGRPDCRGGRGRPGLRLWRIGLETHEQIVLGARRAGARPGGARPSASRAGQHAHLLEERAPVRTDRSGVRLEVREQAARDRRRLRRSENWSWRRLPRRPRGETPSPYRLQSFRDACCRRPSLLGPGRPSAILSGE